SHARGQRVPIVRALNGPGRSRSQNFPGSKSVMATKHVSPSIRQWIITLVCLCAGAGVAKTADRLNTTPAECAARDLKVVTLIEVPGPAQAVGADQLADAAFTMMRARQACHDGRVTDGLAIYDSVLLAPRFAQVR